MNKLVLLVKVSLLNQLGLNRLRQQGWAPPWLKLSLAALLVVVGGAGIVAWLSIYWWALAAVLQKLGMLDLLLLQALLLVSFVCFFKNLYLLPGQLFFFRDYDLLMSLPVETATVLMSKLVAVVAADSLLTTVMTLPPLIVYGIKTGAGPVYYLFGAVLLPFIPLVPLTLAVLFALVTGRLAGRFRRGHKAVTMLAIPVFIAVVAGYLKLSSSTRPVAASVGEVLKTVSVWYPPAALFFDALRERNPWSLLLFIGLSVGWFILFCLLFARFFRAIQERLAATWAGGNYRLKQLKAAPALAALLFKEFRGYVSCPIYILNTSFGMLVLIIFLARALLAGHLLAPAAWDGKEPLICLLIAVFSASICCTTAASVSLEGRSLWILKTAPVDPVTIFQAKLLLNWAVTLPLLAFNAVALALRLHFDLLHWLLVWAVPSVYVVFVSTAGLLINLLYPKLEFKTPTAVVKQSASAMLSFVAAFLAVALPLGLYLSAARKFVGDELYAGLVALVLLTLAAVFWQVLRTRGVRLFAQLHS